MAYDIFISYRRAGGKELARPLKSELERRGYRVFLDFDELKDGVFDRRIMEAIDSSPIFMVVLSPHALDRCVNADDWVRKEIEYALEHGRHIVPVNPDQSFDGFPVRLPESLKSGLGQHQFSEIMFGQLFMASVDKMVHDRIEPLLQQLGRASAAESRVPSQRLKIKSNAACRVLIDGECKADAEPGKLSFIPLAPGEYLLEAECTAVTADRIERELVMGDSDKLERLEFTIIKTYRVGDYYNENGREGVVFEVDATGRHGKIVGMKQSQEQWCTDEEYDNKVVVGADDPNDGMKNQRKIMAIDGWQEKYPAFAWCAEQGDGWYLPAIEELKKFACDDKVHDAVNRTLSQHGGDAIFNKGVAKIYWSSSEKVEWCAWFVGMYGGSTLSDSKYDGYYVRAVSAF